MNRKEYADLALKWAPINYQYIKLKKDKTKKKSQRMDLSAETKRDLVVPINLDGFTENSCKHCAYLEHQHKESREKTNGSVSSAKDEQPRPCENFETKYAEKGDAWDTTDMRKRLKETFTENLIPVAYYSIATTKNYFYILYSFFHADDEKHPCDLEGCLLIIERGKKENKNDDRLVGMMTVSHVFFPRYTYKDRIGFKNEYIEIIKNPDIVKTKLKKFKTKLNDELKKQSDETNPYSWRESLSKFFKEIKRKANIHGTDGKMQADDEMEEDSVDGTARALIQQESQGHGLYALGPKIYWLFKIIRKIKQLFGKLDIIVYYPSSKATTYKIDDLFRYKGMPHHTSIYYELIDVHDEGDRFDKDDDRHDDESDANGMCHWLANEKTFSKKGNFGGDKAKPPWKWVEETEERDYRLWDHPAELANMYFKNSKTNFDVDNETGEVDYIKTMNQTQDPELSEKFDDFAKKLKIERGKWKTDDEN